MAVDFATLFTRLGLIGGTWNAVNTQRGTTQPGYIADIVAEYASPDLNLLDGIWNTLAAYQQTPSGYMQSLQALAAATVIQMVNDDTPLPNLDLTTALNVLNVQFRAASGSFQTPTVSAGSAAYGGSDRGNGLFTAVVTDAVDALAVSANAETLSLACTSDSSTGATNFNEPFSLVTPASVDPSLWTWPAGSGTSLTFNSVNPQVDNAQGNVLANSDFESFVINVPKFFAVITGTPGNDILAGGSGKAYYGANCLQFKNFSGSPLSTIRQPFNSGSGTSYSLLPDTAYAFCIHALKDSGLSGNGTVRIALVDTGTGAILTDDGGNSQSFTFTAASLSTSYSTKSTVFRTPRALPANGVSLQVGLSVALADSGLSVYLDYGSMTPMTRLYAGGPLVSLFSGSTPWAYGDTITLAIANNYGGAWIKLLERWFSLRQKGIQFPVSGSPTISDALITT